MECKGFAQQREEHGMSQQELADRLGVSQVMVARIENGTKTPPLWIVIKAAGVFGCTLDALVYGAAAATSQDSA